MTETRLTKLVKGCKGFTLIELLAVMAIIGILAAIVVPAVSGTSGTSKDAQTQTDAGSTDSAAINFFQNQTQGETLSSETVSTTSKINGSAATIVEQVISSRWPERFITNLGGSTTTASYINEFTTTGSPPFAKALNDVTILGRSDAVISASDLLSKYTAVDLDLLERLGYLQQVPSSSSSLSQNRFHDFLWLFKKQATAGSTGTDSRKLSIFKLSAVTIGDTTIDLKYEQID